MKGTIHFRLDEGLKEALDRYAKRRHWNRSQALVEAVLCILQGEEATDAQNREAKAEEEAKTAAG